MNTIKFWGGAFLTLPILPILYYQGKRIRRNVPVLPEAREPYGTVKGFGSENLNIIILGESTIAGVGVDTHKEGFAGAFAHKLSELTGMNIVWNVYAKSGFNARQVNKSLVPHIKEENADCIIIGLGGNDAFELNRPIRWRKHIGQLIESLQNRFSYTPIVFTNMPPIREFPAFTPFIQWTIGNLVEILGDELESLVNSYRNVHFMSKKITFDEWIKRTHLGNTVSDFFSDGVHPSKLTYELWGQDMANYIFERGIIKHEESIK